MTIETEESVVLRAGAEQHAPLIRWCPGCRRQVEMVTPEQAAQIAGASPRAIHNWIEAGRVHFIEDFGRLWICHRALSRHMSVSEERNT